MTAQIDKNLCNGCPGRAEGCCEEICPGDLYIRKNGKAILLYPEECWDCFACVKACPCSAISVSLPFQISEAKHRLTARIKGNFIHWELLDKSGSKIRQFTIQNRTNKKERYSL